MQFVQIRHLKLLLDENVLINHSEIEQALLSIENGIRGCGTIIFSGRIMDDFGVEFPLCTLKPL